MKVELDELMSTSAIAELAGVTMAAVSNWQARYPEFPEPVWVGAGTRLWLRPQIEAWLADRAGAALERAAALRRAADRLNEKAAALERHSIELRREAESERPGHPRENSETKGGRA